MKRLAAAALAAALAAPAAAGSFSSSARGTTAGEFLNLGAGARAAAMGSAYCAVVDEPSAVYWNPAAMTRVPGRAATLSHALVLNSSAYEYGSYVQNEGRVGVFGFGVQYYTPGKIVQTDEAGTPLSNLLPYDLALSWSYAREFHGFSFGGTVKLIDSKIINSASAGALDLGVLSPTLLDERLRLAFTATNLGGDTISFDQAGAKLPLTLKAGGAYQLLPSLLVSADAVFPKSDQPYAAVGTEYKIAGPSDRLGSPNVWSFLGRAGFSSQSIGSVDGFTGFSLGFGVAVRRASVDYAFAPLGGLGQVHRLSLTGSF